MKQVGNEYIIIINKLQLPKIYKITKDYKYLIQLRIIKEVKLLDYWLVPYI